MTKQIDQNWTTQYCSSKDIDSSWNIRERLLLRMTPDIEFNDVNPTLWNVQISTSGPTRVGLGETYGEKWQEKV